jgi:hypothetical protein
VDERGGRDPLQIATLIRSNRLGPQRKSVQIEIPNGHGINLLAPDRRHRQHRGAVPGLMNNHRRANLTGIEMPGGAIG